MLTELDVVVLGGRCSEEMGVADCVGYDDELELLVFRINPSPPRGTPCAADRPPVVAAAGNANSVSRFTGRNQMEVGAYGSGGGLRWKRSRCHRSEPLHMED